MKTTILFLTLPYLLFFAVTGLAQPRIITTPDGVKQMIEHEDVEEDSIESYLVMKKRAIHMYWNNGFFGVLESGWHGYISWLNCPELLTALDISDAQLKEILKIRRDHNPPEFREMSIEHAIMMIGLRETDILQYFGEEEINKLLERRYKESQALYSSVLSRVAESALTPEQIQKINEIYAATMGKVPMISSRAFEAFDLTDVQSWKVERIKKELEPEFEKYLENVTKHIAVFIIGLEGLESEFEKAQYDWEIADATGKSAIEERFIAKEQELLKIQAEIQSQSRAFATLFKTRVFDVLTEEQRKRHQELTDNPPEHARIFLNVIEGWTGDDIGESESESERVDIE